MYKDGKSSLESRLSSSFSLLTASDEKLDESLGSRLWEEAIGCLHVFHRTHTLVISDCIQLLAAGADSGRLAARPPLC